jgi:hypothetical protein
MKKIITLFVLSFMLFQADLFGQVSRAELLCIWSRNSDGRFFTQIERLTFNSDNTGEEYYETVSFGEAPSTFKQTTKFKWEIDGVGVVYYTILSKTNEETKNGKFKTDTVDMLPISKKENMKIKIYERNRIKFLTMVGKGEFRK